jgi:DNA-binding NarL/FixJ family response regulator
MKEKESLLIVDDDEGTCKSLTLIFGKNNFEIETAYTGQEAIEKAQNRPFNVILMDIKLPDMEGIEMLSALKDINPASAVLIITAYASLETAKRAVNEGASGYITKPINMNEVLTSVKNTIQKQRLNIEYVEKYQSSRKETADLKKKADMLEYRLQFADTILHISSGFISTSCQHPVTNAQVEHALQEIGEFLNIDSSNIFLLSQSGTTYKKTYEWNSEGSTTKDVTPQNITTESFPWLLSMFSKFEPVYLRNINDLPVEATLEKEFFKSRGVKSAITIPLVMNHSVIGFMGMYTVQKPRVWPEDEITLLNIVAEIFAGVVYHSIKEKIRVIVGEERALLRDGVCNVILNAGMELTGEADNMNGLFDLAQQTKPDIIIINDDLPGSGGQNYIEHIKKTSPDSNILVMCQDREINKCFLSTIRAGGNGALPVSSSAEQLINAIKSIYYGHTVTTFDGINKWTQELTNFSQQNNVHTSLNARELEILQLASTGLSNKSIGKRLSLSERTVDSHFRSIFTKANAGSRTEAIYKALKNGWFSVE